jgi:hypothetical protein
MSVKVGQTAKRFITSRIDGLTGKRAVYHMVFKVEVLLEVVPCLGCPCLHSIADYLGDIESKCGLGAELKHFYRDFVENGPHVPIVAPKDKCPLVYVAHIEGIYTPPLPVPVFDVSITDVSITEERTLEPL